MELNEQLAERIEARREEAIDLLCQLIRIDSTNPQYAGANAAEVLGGETRVNELLAERYAQAGLELHWVAKVPERRNLVGVRRGAGGGRSLLLNGHVDTVAGANPEQWDSGSPWEPLIRDGRLYGLGATDMKGAGVSMWLAAQALQDAGVRLRGDLQLHSVCGEESADHALGTSACLEAGFRADAAIVTEPTIAQGRWIVSPVSAGIWYLRIDLVGKATHPGNRGLSLQPGGPGDALGVNALEKAVDLVRALQELERRWMATKRHPLFPPGFFSLMPGVLHADPGMPAPYYFPDRARLEYILYHLPQDDPQESVREIEAYVDAFAQRDPWLREHPPVVEWVWGYPPMNTPWEHPVVQAMARAREWATGVVLPEPSPEHPVNFGAGMDGTWLHRAGIPTAVFGPGELEVAHSVNESVALDDVITAAKALAATAVDWCEAEDA